MGRIRKVLLGVVALFGLSILLFSCGETKEKAFEKPYFDIKGLIEGEMTLLDSTQPEIRKSVSKDGATEEKTMRQINWKEELASFLEADINKPAWANSYTTQEEDTDSTIITVYKTENDNPIKQLTVVQDKLTKRCTSFYAHKQVSNFLYSSTQELEYQPNRGYTISGGLKVNWVFNTDYLIEGKFLQAY